MITKIAAALLTIALFAACETPMTTKRTTVREMTGRYASNNNANSLNEAPPPAEGPEDVPAAGSDVNRNPGLVPSPLLRTNAVGSP